MARRASVIFALGALCLVSIPSAAAASVASGPPPGSHDALRLETLSGPAQYVSGGAARVRVVVPAAVPLVEATVELNGVDVTSAFTTDDQAPHALEGVLTGLPLGPSTVEASVPGPGNSANDRATLTLVNYPITGPMFSGPKQPDFFCSTPGHLAGFDLAGPFLDANCSLPTDVDYYYRAANATWKPYDAGRASSGGHDADDDERRRHRRLRHPLGAGHDQPLHLHDRGPRPDRERPVVASLLEPEAHLLLRRRRGDRPLPGLEQPGRVPLPVRARPGLRDRVVDRDEDEHALQPRPRRRDRAHGQVALRHAVRRSRSTPSGSAARAAPSSSTSTARTTRDCSTARSRSTRTRTWSRRRSTSETASYSSAGWTAKSRRRAPGRSGGCGRTARGWRGFATSNTHREPVPAADTRGWRRQAPPNASKAGAASRRWRSTRTSAPRPGSPRRSRRQSSGRTGTTPSTSTAAIRQRASRARRGTTSASSTACRRCVDGHVTPGEFLELNAEIGGWKPPQDTVQEGCPYVATACPRTSTSGARGTSTSSPDGGVTPAPRAAAASTRCTAAYESGLVFDGKIDIPIIDWRHYLDAELDMHNARQSFAARARHARARRRRVQPGDLVHGCAAGPRVRPDADGARRDGRVAREHRRRSRSSASPATSLPTRSTAASRRTERRSTRAPMPGTGSSTSARPARDASVFPIHGTSRTVAGAPVRRGALQVQAPAGRRRDRPGRLRLVAAERERDGEVEADLPRRRLRLLEGRRGEAARVRLGT